MGEQDYRHSRRSYIPYLVPLWLSMGYMFIFLMFRSFFQKYIVIISLFFIVLICAVVIVPSYLKRRKTQKQRAENICPYCKKKNSPERTQCEFCKYPLNEEYNG